MISVVQGSPVEIFRGGLMIIVSLKKSAHPYFPYRNQSDALLDGFQALSTPKSIDYLVE